MIRQLKALGFQNDMNSAIQFDRCSIYIAVAPKTLRSVAFSLLFHIPNSLLLASNNPVTVVIIYPLLFNSGTTFFNIGTVQLLRS